jgi:hypothetical protein
MASGCMTLVKEFDDMGSWGLKHGENCIVWSTADELARHLDGTACPDKERHAAMRRIGAAGAKLMEEHHCWHVRMLELLALVSKVRQGGHKPALFRPEL